LGISPKSSIDIVYSRGVIGDQIFNFLLNQTDGPPDVLSISYGVDVAKLTLSQIKSYNHAAAALTAAGTTIVVSSGDDGARGLLKNSDICEALSVQIPAILENVVAVGATQLPFPFASGGGGKEQAATCSGVVPCPGDRKWGKTG